MATGRNSRASGETSVGRKRAGEEMFGSLEPDKKKKKVAKARNGKSGRVQGMRRKLLTATPLAFKPQPLPLPNSSSTPPDELVDLPSLPPPPSTKKAARKRLSTKPERDRLQSDSPEPAPRSAKRQKVDRGRERSATAAPGLEDGMTLEEELGGERGRWERTLQSTLTSTSRSDIVGVSKSSRPRPSAPRPSSPPRNGFSTSSRSRPSMGPPTGVPTRKSRQSRGLVEVDSVMPIPISDTPIIKKNKEMRRDAERRSSFGMRGKRASSSFERGDLPMPHHNVPYQEFYKHISVDIYEPRRLAQLLVWCAKRALDEAIASSPSQKGKEKAKEVRTEDGDRMIQQIMDEFMGNLTQGNVEIKLDDRSAESNKVASAMPLRPHPKNVSNREAEMSMDAFIKQLKREDAQWSGLIRQANAKQHTTIQRLSEKSRLNEDPTMVTAEGWMQDAMTLAQAVIDQGEGDLSSMGEFADVEYKVDTLLQTSHSALQYSHQATRFLDGIFSALTLDLRSRENSNLASTTYTDTDRPDPMSIIASASASASSSAAKDPINLLRALAAVESSAQSEETVEKAARLLPVLTTSTTPKRVARTPKRGVRTPGNGDL
ncbi:kinetochore protein Mis13/DSN1, partial [Tremellales sp. Uapishka_1]